MFMFFIVAETECLQVLNQSEIASTTNPLSSDF